MERISCTVDELAEALAVEGSADPGSMARRIASFLKADRLPEPAEPLEDTPIEEIEWWEE